MKCKFNKEKAKSALKKAGLAVRGLEHFIMASDKYFKSLSKKEADSVQKDMLRLISSIKARSSRSMRGGTPEDDAAAAAAEEALRAADEAAADEAAAEGSSVVAAAVTSTNGQARSEGAADEAAAEGSSVVAAVTSTNGQARSEGAATAVALEDDSEGAATAVALEDDSEGAAKAAKLDEQGNPITTELEGGSAFGLQPNSRTGILYSALWLATFCLSGGPTCSFTPGMLEVMPCCSKWSVLVKPLVENASDLYRLNLIGLAKTAPNAKLFLQANAIFGSTIQSFYGMSMNRSANRSIKRSFLTRRKKAHPKKTKRIRKNKTRKRK